MPQTIGRNDTMFVSGWLTLGRIPANTLRSRESEGRSRLLLPNT